MTGWNNAHACNVAFADVATKTAFLENLNSPFGMALVDEDLYIANTDSVMRFHYKEGATKITDPGIKLTDLPAPVRSIIIGPRICLRAATDRGSMQLSVPTARRARTVSIRSKTGPQFSKSTVQPESRAYSHRA